MYFLNILLQLVQAFLHLFSLQVKVSKNFSDAKW